MATKRWQDIANFIIGIWLFISPWVLSFATSPPSMAAWNAYFLGVAIVAFAAAAVYLPRAWEEGLNMLFGIWLIVSPWAMGFAAHTRETSNAVVTGILVTILATWAMVYDKDVQKWWHDHHAAS